MSAPAWFDYQTYFNNKLAQLQELEPTANWTAESLTEAFTTAQYSVTADGMYKHFVDHGNAENISPSPYFVYDEYMANKLAQLQRDEPNAGWTTVEQVEDAFEAAGLSAWDHYLLHGMAEGINPSAGFDTKAYMEAKLAQLQATEPTKEWTMETLIDAFQEAGLNPIEHYVLHGQYEDLSYAPDGGLKPATDTLTVERDVLTLGAGDQIIEGVSSALMAENTLNANDNIDGGEGNDTLRVTLDSNFSGFKVTDDPETTGGMKNVENVELINNGQIARTFSAKGSEGVTTYSLSGQAGITVKDLAAAGVTVNVNGMQKEAKVEFTSDAVKGDSDSLTFGLTNVGAAGATSKDDVYLNLVAKGVENVSINATGSNLASLKDVADATSLTVTGSGSLTVDEVASKLTSVDASAATGNVDIDLTKGGKVTSIKGGAGDDTFTVKNLAPNVVLEGGEGNDTLILKNASGTLQPTMSGFETIGITDASGAILLSAKNAQDFTGLLLEDSKNMVTVSGLTNSAFTVTSKGDGTTGGSTNTAEVTDAVDLTVNVEASAGAEKAETVKTDLEAGKATSAVINVGANVDTTGSSFSLAAAESVQLNVASSWVDGAEQTSFIGKIEAAKAESLEVKAEGNLGVDGSAATFNVANASSVIISAARDSYIDLQAAKATDVNLTFNGTTALKGNLSGAQSVTIDQQKGTLTLDSTVDLSSLNTLTVSGEGSNSGVKLGALGSSGDANSYDVTVTAIGLAGKEGGYGFEAGDVTSAQGVTLDFSQMTGNAKVQDVEASGGDVTIITSDMANTKVGTVSASGDITIDASGKMGDFSGGNFTATSGDISLTFDGGAKIDLGTLSGDNVTLDASGYLNAVSGTPAVDQMSVGNITADSATVLGSELGKNTFTITADTLNFTGGLDVDTVNVSGDANTTNFSATLNTGEGYDQITVDVSGSATLATFTLSGDLGGNGIAQNQVVSAGQEAGDFIDIKFGSNALSSLKTVDISGLDGYMNTLTFNTTTVLTNVETLKLGGGQDKVILAHNYSGDQAGKITIDGFTAGQGGDVLRFSGGSMSGDYTNATIESVSEFSAVKAEANAVYYYEGSELSSLTFASGSANSGNALILFMDTDTNVLSYAEVDLSNVTSYTATGSVKLTGVEGDLTFDNFDFS